MALNPSLNTSELQRIKAELGFNQLAVGAEPYIGVTRYFEQIVVPNLQAGALASSSTTVSSTTPPTPAAVTLTLDDPSGFNLLDHVIVDVDDAQEQATLQSLAGNTITLRLQKPHSGTYPVAVEGGISLVRLYLERCRRVSEQIARWGPRAGVKKADEVELFGGAGGRGGREPSGFKTLEEMQLYFRSELCTLLFGVGDITQFGGSGARIAPY